MSTSSSLLPGLAWRTRDSCQSASYTTSTTYDALDRVVTQTTPDDSVTQPYYNDGRLLERVDADMRGAGTDTVYVEHIDSTPGM